MGIINHFINNRYLCKYDAVAQWRNDVPAAVWLRSLAVADDESNASTALELGACSAPSIDVLLSQYYSRKVDSGARLI